MKKTIFVLLALALCFSMCACGGDEATGNIIETEEVETSQSPETETTEAVAQQVITTDDVVGTWILELPFKQGAKGVPAFQMDLHKGGTGEGYEKKDGKIDKSKMYMLKWEIKDDVIAISYEADPVSWTFEMNGDKTHITEVESENSFVKE